MGTNRQPQPHEKALQSPIKHDGGVNVGN